MHKYKESKSPMHCMTQKFLKYGTNQEPQDNFDEYHFYVLALDNLLDIGNSASSVLKISWLKFCETPKKNESRVI